MGSRQRKVERNKSQRQKKRRTQQIHALRSERRLAGDVHPIYACKANRDWQKMGKATIFFARRVAPGRVTMAAFLVDTWAMGLKDAWGRIDIARSEFDKRFGKLPSGLEMSPLNPGIARHLVYGGIELATELGFRLPGRYQRWTAILGPLPDGESPDMSLFRVDGKVHLVCDERDLAARLVGTTPEKFLERPDVDFILGVEGSTLVDEEVDEVDDMLDQLGETMAERVRQWCFANGQQPHPLLPEVVSAMMEATVQQMPPDLDPDDDVLALVDEQEDEVFERMASFLSASFESDRQGLGEAMAQLQGFMQSTDTPEEFIEALGINDWPTEP